MRARLYIPLAALLLLATFGSAVGRSSGINAMISGFSGKLRAVFALPGESPGIPSVPGVYRWLAGTRQALSLVVLTPFSAKVNGRIGPYRLGNWPFERRAPRDPAYANPEGFIEVTPGNFGTHVSEH